MATPKGGPTVAPNERRKRLTMNQNDTLKLWTESGVLVPQRIIYLGSVTTDSEGNESMVDSAMAKNFEIAMRILEYLGPTAPITVMMNNPGGDYYHGMAIYDRIMDSPCHVTIHASGYVMSMGSIIFQAADKRLMTRNATMLLHYGTSGYSGHTLDHERSVDESKRLRIVMEDTYLERMLKKDPKMTRAKVHELLQFDTFLDASRAIRLGLADGLTPQFKHKKPRVRGTTPSL